MVYTNFNDDKKIHISIRCGSEEKKDGFSHQIDLTFTIGEKPGLTNEDYISFLKRNSDRVPGIIEEEKQENQ